MQARDSLAEEFEQNRRHLRGVAYRMLGSMTEADDAVQEAWLRLDRGGAGGVRDLRAWLTTVVGRVCLDMLRTRQAKKEYAPEEWRPEPIVADQSPGPEAEVEMADSVGLALLVVLETLTPTERLAFVLHDVFGVEFDEIGPIVGKSTVAARQLASRARRRARAGTRLPEGDLDEQQRVVNAFLKASRSGSFDDLMAVLDPSVVLRTDRVPSGRIGWFTVTNAPDVARHLLQRGAHLAHLAKPALVNGAPGFVVSHQSHVLAIVGFTVAEGRIVAIDLTTDPHVIEGLKLPASW